MAHNKKKQKRKGRVLKTTLSERKNKKKKKKWKRKRNGLFFQPFKRNSPFFNYTSNTCMYDCIYFKNKTNQREKQAQKKKVLVSFPPGRTRYTTLVSLTFEEHPRMA